MQWNDSPTAVTPRRRFVEYLLGGGLFASVASFLYPALRYLVPPPTPDLGSDTVVAGRVGSFSWTHVTRAPTHTWLASSCGTRSNRRNRRVRRPVRFRLTTMNEQGKCPEVEHPIRGGRGPTGSPSYLGAPVSKMKPIFHPPAQEKQT